MDFVHRYKLVNYRLKNIISLQPSDITENPPLKGALHLLVATEGGPQTIYKPHL